MKIAEDKIKHIVAGYIIVMVFGLLFNPIIGLIASIVIGSSKELIYDKLLCKGCCEKMDFVATVIGGLSCFLPMIL